MCDVTGIDINPRPLPMLPDLRYDAFFEALRTDRIAIRRCLSCGQPQWPPRELCFACHSDGFASLEINQVGRIYTYTVVYRAFHPWFADRVPYGVLVVDLGNGVRMLGNYWAPDVEELRCDMEVRAVFENTGAGVTLLSWERT